MPAWFIYFIKYVGIRVFIFLPEKKGTNASYFIHTLRKLGYLNHVTLNVHLPSPIKEPETQKDGKISKINIGCISNRILKYYKWSSLFTRSRKIPHLTKIILGEHNPALQCFWPQKRQKRSPRVHRGGYKASQDETVSLFWFSQKEEERDYDPKTWGQKSKEDKKSANIRSDHLTEARGGSKCHLIWWTRIDFQALNLSLQLRTHYRHESSLGVCVRARARVIEYLSSWREFKYLNSWS